jgi:hypothetical protein
MEINSHGNTYMDYLIYLFVLNFLIDVLNRFVFEINYRTINVPKFDYMLLTQKFHFSKFI